MDNKLKKYAFLIEINNNKDIPNAIVLSYSIRINSSLYNIIAKISKNIDNEILMNFFDIIIYDNKKLNNYEKILMIDINSLIDKNIDYLFDIKNISKKDINNNIIKYKHKPYIYNNNDLIENEIKKKSNILWFKYYREIINNNFDLLDNILLEESNKMLKYYIYNLNNSDSNNNSQKYKNLELLYDTKITTNQEYYHTNISKEYNDTGINFYTDNIKIEDLILYINILLKKKYDYTKYDNIRLLLDDSINKELILEIYLKYSPSILIILINNEKIISNEIKKNIIYSKNILLDNYELKNILFNINQEYVYNERIDYLNKTYKEDNYNIKLLCFETKDYIDFKDSENIIICENIDKKIRTIGLLLKKYNERYDFIEKYKNKKETLIIQSLKKWIYNNYNGEEMRNIIVFVNNKKYIILDNNKYENSINKNKFLNNNKLYFMKLLFLYSEEYNKTIKINPIYKTYKLEDCYEIDGIVFFNCKSNI